MGSSGGFLPPSVLMDDDAQMLAQELDRLGDVGGLSGLGGEGGLSGAGGGLDFDCATGLYDSSQYFGPEDAKRPRLDAGGPPDMTSTSLLA